MAQHKIIISDTFAKKGVERLTQNQALFCVSYHKEGFQRKELLAALPEAEGLIIRSSTKVDKEALARALRLKIIIRAGVGVDNIDIPEASRRGIIVANAPGANSISTAEHAIALLLASARNIPQAHASMKASKWEKSRFKGCEVTAKTLGVLGLGRIGREVVLRAKALQLHVIAHDPYIGAATLEDMNVEIVKAKELLNRSDFITVHTPLTESTRDFINLENLSQLKDGVILINAARGGIYNEEALAQGLKSGKIACAALDVFTVEPLPPDSPLRQLDNCILSPHLGASTGDAELAVALDSADTMTRFFQDGSVRNTCNFPVIEPKAKDFLQAYYEGGMRVGKFLGLMAKELCRLEIHYHGEIAKHKTEAVRCAIQYGLLVPILGEEVNILSAPMTMQERNIQLRELRHASSKSFSSYVRLRITDVQGESMELQYTTMQGQALVVSLFGLPLEFKPEGILLAIKNQDIPGVVGSIGTFLGEKGVNIASLELSRDAKGGSAYCIISIDEVLSQSTLEELEELEHITDSKQIDLR